MNDNTQTLELENIELRNDWKYDPTNDDLFRFAETFTGNGCNLCGGHQTTDPDADWYCPHMDGDGEHIEAMYINEDETAIIVIQGDYEHERFDITQENITHWMETHPNTHTE